MNQSELLRKLDQLLELPHETEWIEFKAARNQYDFNKLLMDKLSDVLSEKQKCNKVRNLLYAMSRRDKTIRNFRSGNISKWTLILDEKTKD